MSEEMPMGTTDWTILLSGPIAQRAPLLADLARFCVDTAQPRGDMSHGMPRDDTEGWLTCRAESVDTVATAAARSEWRLRQHWPTPTCPVCAGRQDRCTHCGGTGRTNIPAPDPARQLQAELDSLRARLEALEGKGAPRGA